MSSLTVQAVGAAADAVEHHLGTLAEERFASRLFAQDATLWGPAAEAEASVRLSWVGLPRTSRPLVGEVEALREGTGYVLVWGGVTLWRSLMRLDLIDEFRFDMYPYLTSRGTVLFDDVPAGYRLDLVSSAASPGVSRPGIPPARV